MTGVLTLETAIETAYQRLRFLQLAVLALREASDLGFEPTEISGLAGALGDVAALLQPLASGELPAHVANYEPTGGAQ